MSNTEKSRIDHIVTRLHGGREIVTDVRETDTGASHLGHNAAVEQMPAHIWVQALAELRELHNSKLEGVING